MLAYYLYRHKNVMPWEFAAQTPGARAVVEAFAILENEELLRAAGNLYKNHCAPKENRI